MALKMKCVLRRLQISLRKYQSTAAIMQLQILKHTTFLSENGSKCDQFYTTIEIRI